jgi:hypothetical protein
MSFSGRKNVNIKIDCEAPTARDDAKLLSAWDQRQAQIVENGHFDLPKTPVTPTTPVIYYPKSPSLGKRYIGK